MIGGDFFDYLDSSEGAFGFALGDVTGKGPSAALVTAVVQGIIVSHADAAAKPGELVSLVNRVLMSRRIESRFATIFLASLSPAGVLTYCNAAQNPPLLFTSNRWERLEAGGTLVGAFRDAAYEQGERQLTPGDTIVLFSDGIVEALNAAGEEFEEQRVREAVQPHLGEPVERVLDALLARLEAFTHGTTQTDDLTAVVVRYRGVR
jgi:sigma-B regulation protein RsbU (phosphoserine phosphatase)